MDPNYMPHNVEHNHNEQYLEVENTLPRKVYNIQDNFIGYSWSEGDTFTFNINVNDTIKVKEDSIINNESGVYPTTETIGYKCQQAYNTVDNKSWTCVDCLNGMFIWVLNTVVTYSKYGTKEINMNIDMQGKTLKFDLYNFRWELLENVSKQNSDTLQLHIDEELSDKLPSGLYYGVISIIDDDNIQTKDKFTIMIK
jgi:hypothetical protein